MRNARVLVTLVALLVTAGCGTSEGGPLSGDGVPVSAVPSTPPAPETPADALEAAQFVITADIGRKVGTADFHGVAGNVYSVSNVGLRGWKGDDEGSPTCECCQRRPSTLPSPIRPAIRSLGLTGSSSS